MHRLPTFRQDLTGFSLLYGVLNWIHLADEHHRHVCAFFLLAILLEWLWGLWRGVNTYRLTDSVSSLTLGGLSQARRFVALGVGGVVYSWAMSVTPIEPWSIEGWMPWVVAFVLYDLCYYCAHRCGHTVALFWAATWFITRARTTTCRRRCVRLARDFCLAGFSIFRCFSSVFRPRWWWSLVRLTWCISSGYTPSMFRSWALSSMCLSPL